MPITINGSGTITGLSVGGLPDGTVDGDTLASGVGGKILQVQSTARLQPGSSGVTSWTTLAAGDAIAMHMRTTDGSSSQRVLVYGTITLEAELS